MWCCSILDQKMSEEKVSLFINFNGTSFSDIFYTSKNEQLGNMFGYDFHSFVKFFFFKNNSFWSKKSINAEIVHTLKTNNTSLSNWSNLDTCWIMCKSLTGRLHTKFHCTIDNWYQLGVILALAAIPSTHLCLH